MSSIRPTELPKPVDLATGSPQARAHTPALEDGIPTPTSVGLPASSGGVAKPGSGRSGKRTSGWDEARPLNGGQATLPRLSSAGELSAARTRVLSVIRGRPDRLVCLPQEGQTYRCWLRACDRLVVVCLRRNGN